MEHKYKVGDKVRVKADVDLGRVSILLQADKLRGSEVEIVDAYPGQEGWMDTELNDTPTYSVQHPSDQVLWRMPESFLEAVDGGS